MGDFVVNCMASGLPIPKGTKTKVLFVTSKNKFNDRVHGGVYVHDMYNFASWPIDITMDDYGGHGCYFGEENFRPNGKPYDSKVKDLNKQISWKVFYPMLQSKRDEKVDPYDWTRNMIHGNCGFWSHPVYANCKFDDGIQPIGMTYYRKDIWDYLVKMGKSFVTKGKKTEFEIEMRKRCEPIPYDLDKNSKEYRIAMMKKDCDLPWGDFLHDDLQRLLTNREHYTGWQTHAVVDISLTGAEQKELMDSTVEMYYFTNGLREIGRPILPSVSLAPQCAKNDRDFLKNNVAFHDKCSSLMKATIKKVR